MLLSTDVTLAKSQTPVFPDRCVRCGVTRPGDWFVAKTHTVGWWTYLLWTWGPSYSVTVPACPSCRVWIRRQRLLRLIVLVVGGSAAIIVASWLLGWYRGPFRLWLGVGLSLVLMMPYFLWEAFMPRPFDMTATTKTVDYTFRDEGYADHFRLVNLASEFDDGALDDNERESNDAEGEYEDDDDWLDNDDEPEWS